MKHPTELLTDLVDGAIGSADRAVVEAHLASCATCRAEVADAELARGSLRSLPDPVVPPGIVEPAIAEAERAARRIAPEVSPLRRRTTPVWHRWAAGAATAAALLILVVALPDVGDRGPSETRAAGEGASRALPAAAAGLEILDADLDTAALQTLALSYAGGSPEMGAVDAGAPVAGGDVVAQGFDEARACISQAVPDLGGEPVRLIAARFEGTPAYVAVFLSGPGAGQPPDTAEVWVVDRQDCTALSSTVASM